MIHMHLPYCVITKSSENVLQQNYLWWLYTGYYEDCKHRQEIAVFVYFSELLVKADFSKAGAAAMFELSELYYCRSHGFPKDVENKSRFGLICRVPWTTNKCATVWLCTTLELTEEVLMDIFTSKSCNFRMRKANILFLCWDTRFQSQDDTFRDYNKTRLHKENGMFARRMQRR